MGICDVSLTDAAFVFFGMIVAAIILVIAVTARGK